MSDKTKQLIKNIIVAVLSAILTWLGVSCTNMLSIQKKVKVKQQILHWGGIQYPCDVAF